MSEQSVAVVRGMYESFATGDVPAVLGAMAEDIEWYEAEGMPYGGLHRGPAAVARSFRRKSLPADDADHALSRHAPRRLASAPKLRSRC